MKTLKHYRQEAGLSVKAVAEHMNVTGRVVYSWEAGERGPGMVNLIRLLDLYQVDPPISTLPTLVPIIMKQKELITQ